MRPREQDKVAWGRAVWKLEGWASKPSSCASEPSGDSNSISLLVVETCNSCSIIAGDFYSGPLCFLLYPVTVIEIRATLKL